MVWYVYTATSFVTCIFIRSCSPVVNTVQVLHNNYEITCCHNNADKMAGRGKTQKHGTITVHSPELCDEIFGHSRTDAVRSKVNRTCLLLVYRYTRALIALD